MLLGQHKTIFWCMHFQLNVPIYLLQFPCVYNLFRDRRPCILIRFSSCSFRNCFKFFNNRIRAIKIDICATHIEFQVCKKILFIWKLEGLFLHHKITKYKWIILFCNNAKWTNSCIQTTSSTSQNSIYMNIFMNCVILLNRTHPKKLYQCS